MAFGLLTALGATLIGTGILLVDDGGQLVLITAGALIILAGAAGLVVGRHTIEVPGGKFVVNEQLSEAVGQEVERRRRSEGLPADDVPIAKLFEQLADEERKRRRQAKGDQNADDDLSANAVVVDGVADIAIGLLKRRGHSSTSGGGDRPGQAPEA